MRRVRYAVAMSLDGCIAGPRGEADWIVSDRDIDFGAIWRQYDTLLMGRGTYEAMRAMGGAGGSTGGMNVVVVSRTLVPADHPGVTIVSDNVRDAVQRMRQAAGKDIWLFGGGTLFRSLREMDLVDTVEVAVVPVVLGQGIRLVADGDLRKKLRLTRHHVYPKSGIVSLDYEVVRGRRKKA